MRIRGTEFCGYNQSNAKKIDVSNLSAFYKKGIQSENYVPVPKTQYACYYVQHDQPPYHSLPQKK